MAATQRQISGIAEMIIERCIYGGNGDDPREEAERINRDEGWEVPSSRSAKRVRVIRLSEGELQQAYDLAVTRDGEEQRCLEWQSDVRTQAKLLPPADAEDIATWRAPIQFVLDRLNENQRWITHTHVALFTENLLPLVALASHLTDQQGATAMRQNALGVGRSLQQAIACLYAASALLRLLSLPSDKERPASALARDGRALSQEYADCQHYLRDALSHLEQFSKARLPETQTSNPAPTPSHERRGVVLSFDEHARRGKGREKKNT